MKFLMCNAISNPNYNQPPHSRKNCFNGHLYAKKNRHAFKLTSLLTLSSESIVKKTFWGNLVSEHEGSAEGLYKVTPLAGKNKFFVALWCHF